MHSTDEQRALSLLRDERGGVAVEYLIVVACCLFITVALFGLGNAVRNAETRATEVILSDVP
jgi:Flp pilus assembly pilin Flp